MKNITIQIRDDQYALFLQFLRTLQYVKVKETELSNTPLAISQLTLLQQTLQQQSRPLFPKIEDPLTWQKQQRDEWS